MGYALASRYTSSWSATTRAVLDGSIVFVAVTSLVVYARDVLKPPASRAAAVFVAVPVGAWLLTGTSLVPPEPYTAKTGDLVRIAIDGLGELRNRVSLVKHSGAEAKPTRHAKR